MFHHQEGAGNVMFYKRLYMQLSTLDLMQQKMENIPKKVPKGPETNINTESVFFLKSYDVGQPHFDITYQFPVFLKTRFFEDQEGLLKAEEAIPTIAVPTLNVDRSFFTPCFVLEPDKALIQRNQSFYMEYHQKQVSEMSQEPQEFYLASPCGLNLFCGVCKVHFEDYLEHIMLDDHQAQLKNRQQEKKVTELISLFKKKQYRSLKADKKIQKASKKPSRTLEKQRQVKSVCLSKKGSMQEYTHILTSGITQNMKTV